MTATSGSSELSAQSISEQYGLGTLADGEPGMDPELLCALYRYARNENGNRNLFERDATFAKGWINLDAADARNLIASMTPMDDAADMRQARRMARANLEAQSWNDVLGIDSPPLKCVVKIHGSKWGLRFQSVQSGLKGRESLNEDLPPIPANTDDPPAKLVKPSVHGRDQAGRANKDVPPAPRASGRLPADAAQSDAVAACATLRKAGMPA